MLGVGGGRDHEKWARIAVGDGSEDCNGRHVNAILHGHDSIFCLLPSSWNSAPDLQTALVHVGERDFGGNHSRQSDGMAMSLLLQLLFFVGSLPPLGLRAEELHLRKSINPSKLEASEVDVALSKSCKTLRKGHESLSLERTLSGDEGKLSSR